MIFLAWALASSCIARRRRLGFQTYRNTRGRLKALPDRASLLRRLICHDDGISTPSILDLGSDAIGRVGNQSEGKEVQ